MHLETNRKLLQSLVSDLRASMAPPPDIPIDVWCDQNLIIPTGAMPGPWDTDYVPFWRQPMRDMTNDGVEQVWLMCSAQIGKTTTLQAIKAYFAAADPSPQMMVHPDDKSLSDFVQYKYMPMIQASTVLRRLIQMPKPGKSGSTNRSLSYPGGFDIHVSAGSSNSLRGRSVRIGLSDEVDGFRAAAEGDVLDRVFRRTSAFANGKHFISSTPTDEDTSRIERGFLEGDQCQWYVPCKDCDVFAPFEWANVKWDKDADGKNIASTAHYVCKHCGSVHTDAHKPAMNRRGMWVATAAPKDPKVRSYHINELASPWRTFEDVVRAFLSAKGDLSKMKVWTNTSLGETWKSRTEKVDWEILQKRAEPYPVLRAPRGVRIITAGVDVQHNRLAVSIWGYGRRDESWLLFHAEIFGDVDQPEVWEELDDLRRRVIQSERGKDLIIMACAVDSSDGAKMHAVYNYCRGKRREGVFPIKGSSISTSPVIGTGSKQDVDWKGKKYAQGVELYIVGGHIIRSTLYSRMANAVAGSAGYMHLPTAMSEDYFKQLCADKYVTTVSKGLPVSKWVTDGRNEAIDCAVYSYAAAYLVGLPSANWDKLDRDVDPEGYAEAKKLALETANADTPTSPEPGVAEPAPKPPAAPVRKGPRVIKSSWNTGWRT